MDASQLIGASSLASQVGYGGVQPAERVKNALIIVREFTKAGWPLQMALAAVVNANAESGLNPRAVGDGGRSVGLFQIHDGRGTSWARTFDGDRTNPTYNTRWILKHEMTPQAAYFRGLIASGASISKLTEEFALRVERPYGTKGGEVVNTHGAKELVRRTDMARELFGTTLANQPWTTADVVQTLAPGAGGSGAIILLVALAVAGYVYSQR